MEAGNWLKDHSYLAKWLSFRLSFQVTVWRTKGAMKPSDINWTRGGADTVCL